MPLNNFMRYKFFSNGYEIAERYFYNNVPYNSYRYNSYSKDIFEKLMKVDSSVDYKYLYYIVKQYIDNGIFVDKKDIDKIEEGIKEGILKDFNIYDSKYENYNELKRFLKTFTTKNEIERETEEEKEYLYKDDNIEIFIPVTERCFKRCFKKNGSMNWFINGRNSWDNYKYYLQNGLIDIICINISSDIVSEDKRKIGIIVYNKNVKNVDGFKKEMDNVIKKAKDDGFIDILGNKIKLSISFRLKSEDFLFKTSLGYKVVEIFNANDSFISVYELYSILDLFNVDKDILNIKKTINYL